MSCLKRSYRFVIVKNYYKLISIRLNHGITNEANRESTYYINELMDNLHDEWINRQQSFVRDPIPLPHNINTKIVDIIDNQINGVELLNIIIKNKNNMNHPSIYGKAMQKCAMLKDWKSVHEIMKILISHSTLKPTLIEFNIFINNMALSDSPEICIKYFQIMIKKYEIKPDIITFSSIIKSLRLQIKYKEAETCWKIMIEKYNLKPHEILYCEMISVYSRAGQIEKATKIFNEYIDRIQLNEMELDVVIFNAYLNGFSRCGDMKGIQNVLNLFEKYGLELTVKSMADIMRGCIKSKQYKQCIKAIQQWTDNGKIPNMAMMSLKCISLAQMIGDIDDNEFNEKHKLYVRLKNTIYYELEFYGLQIIPIIAKTQLDGAMFLYKSDPLKIVKIFESLLDKKLIGYQQFDKWTGKMCIDLHLFTLSQAQFIIRYLFGFRFNELMKRINDNNDDKLIIIVGKGKHRTGDGENENGTLRKFIMDELLSWSPSIHCYISPENAGQIIVNKCDMIPYQGYNQINQEMNEQMNNK